MEDLVKKYLMDKYGQDYEQNAQSQYDAAKSANKLGNLGANIGESIAAISGKGRVGDSDQYFQSNLQKAYDDSLGKIQKDKESYVKDTMNSASLKDLVSKQEIEAAQKDPNARQSVIARALAKKYGLNVDDSASYNEISQLMDPKKMLETEAAANVEFNKQKQLRQMDQQFKSMEAEKEREAKKGSSKLEGFSALDKDYAKEYNEYTSSGRQSVDKNLERLENAKAKLREMPSASGRFMGRLPDILKSEDAIKLRQDVQAAAQGALKATLGAQFTEKEGERIMQMAYDEKLSPEANIQKIDSAIKELAKNKQVQDQKAKYFEERGTLQGFKPISSESSSASKSMEMGQKTVKITNGQETLEIPIEDLAEAKKEGFMEVSNMAGK